MKNHFYYIQYDNFKYFYVYFLYYTVRSVLAKMRMTGESKILFIEISPAIIYNDIEI